MVWAPITRAASVSDPDALIKQLQAKVAELQTRIIELTAKLPANAISSNEETPKANQKIDQPAVEKSQKPTRLPVVAPSSDDLKPSRYGEYSTSVFALQTELAARGYYQGPVTGRYAKATKDAVAKFKKDFGIIGDGRVATTKVITTITNSLCSVTAEVTPKVPTREISIGATQVPLAKVTLTAPKTCDVTVKKVTVSLDAKESAVKNVAANLTLATGDGTLGTVITIPSWINNEEGYDLTIPSGKSVTLTISADVVGVGSGMLRAGISYIEAVKTGTMVSVGTKQNYFGEWMKLIVPPEEDAPETDSAVSDNQTNN